MKKSKNLRKVMSFCLAVALVLCTMTFPASAEGDGYCIENISSSATTYTAAQFKADIDSATKKYVFTADNDGATIDSGSKKNLNFPYNGGTAKVTRTKENWEIVSYADRQPASGENYYAMNTTTTETFTFSGLGTDKPVAMGMVIVTRNTNNSGDNWFNRDVTVTVTYSDSANNETETKTITSTKGNHDNTFYGFKAPKGCYITSYKIDYSASPVYSGIDEIGVIFDEAPFIGNATEYTREEMEADLADTDNEYKAIVDFSANGTITDNKIAYTYGAGKSGTVAVESATVEIFSTDTQGGCVPTSGKDYVMFTTATASESSPQTITLDLSAQKVKAVGLHSLTRTSPYTLEIQAKYSDGTNSDASTYAQPSLTDSAIFYGFEAPEGKTISALTIKTTNTWPRFDDLWLIFEDDSIFKEVIGTDVFAPIDNLESFTGNLVGTYTFANTTGVEQNVTIYMAKFAVSGNVKTLIDVVKADAVTVASGESVKLITPVMTISEGNAGGVYRLFLWNDSLVPLANIE